MRDRLFWTIIATVTPLAACGPGGQGATLIEGPAQTGGQVPTEVSSWQPYGDGLSGASIVDVRFDTRTPGVVYATGANTVYQSTDSGQTWHTQGHFTAASIGFLAFVGSNADELMATSGSGVIASRDAGKTWAQLALDGMNVSSLTVHPSQPLRAYVGVRGTGVLRSDDGGKTWGGVTDGYPYMDTIAVDVDPRDPDVVVAGGILLNDNDGYSSQGVVMRTADGGQSWQTVVQGVGDVWNVTRCASDPDVLYTASDVGAIRSADGGKTWTTYASGMTEDVAITPARCNDIVAMVTKTGPLHSADGGQTFGAPLTSGVDLNPFGTWPGRMAIDPQHDGTIVLGSHGGIWVTATAGAQWRVASGVLGMVVSALNTSPMEPSRLWLTSWGSGLWERPSPSQPWQRVQGLPADYTFAAAAHPYTANRVLVGAWSTLYQSSDGSSFAADSLSQNEFAFAFDPRDASVLYVATQLEGIYKSTDGGATWVAANNGLTPWDEQLGRPVIDVWSIVVDPADPNTLYVGTNGRGLYKSSDGATSWTSVLAPTETIGCLVAVPGTQPNVFACVHGQGVQSTHDGGATWVDASNGLPTLDVGGMISDAAADDLYATTTVGVFAKHGTQPWVGLDLGGLPGKGAGSPAIVVDGPRRLLVVAAAGGVYSYQL